MRRVRPPFFNEGKEYYIFSMDNSFYNNLALFRTYILIICYKIGLREINVFIHQMIL